MSQPIRPVVLQITFLHMFRSTVICYDFLMNTVKALVLILSATGLDSVVAFLCVAEHSEADKESLHRLHGGRD